MTSHNETRMVRFIFSTSMGLSIILLILLMLKDLKLALIGITGTGLIWGTGWIFLKYSDKSRKATGLFITLAVLNLLFITPELVLRNLKFRYESGIQFGHPRPTHFIHFVTDHELFWRLNPESKNVNSFGFPGDEIIMPKDSNTFRLLYLGDSCMQQGYPEKVETLLNSNGTNSLKVESVNLALSGYTSYQGKIVAKRYGLKIDPDIALINYGWNDHWLAFGDKDSQKVIHETPKWFSLIMHSRFIQWTFWIIGKFKGTEIKPSDSVRVPADEYRQNLIDMIRIFRNENIPVILFTAPSAHRKIGVADYLVESHFAKNKMDIMKLHDQYNEIVRQVASEMNVACLDLEEKFKSKSNEEYRTIFLSDGIHYTESGLDTMAAQNVQFLKHLNLIDQK